MRKIFTTILSAITLTATSILPAAGLFAPKNDLLSSPSVIAAHAETERPTCTALTDGYSAVAHGNTLYYYDDLNGGVWQKYVHTSNGQPADITQMHFAGGSTLYFHDEDETLYRFELTPPATENDLQELPQTVTPVETNISTFYVTATDLYYAKFTTATLQTSVHHLSLTDNEKPLKSQIFNKFFTDLAYSADTLYALEYGSNNLYRLSLEEGTAPKEIQLPDGVNEISFFHGGLYCTTDDALYTYSTEDFSSPTVQAGTFTALSSFQGTAYFLQAGKAHTYSVQTGVTSAGGAFTRPVLDQIPSKGLLNAVQTALAAPEIVLTRESALLFQVTLTETNDVFRDVTATRLPSTIMLKIAETEDFALLSHHQNGYLAYLVDKRNIQPLGTSEYTPSYDAPKTGRLTSKVNLYKFPQMELPALTTLSKDAEITLLGEIKGLEREYYKVEYDGQTGYIPKAYVTERSYANQPTEDLLLGEGENKDGIWRLVYILLGAAIICILVDFLILRKPEA